MEKSSECPSKAHALLGASSAHKWLNCTPSAIAESLIPDGGTDYTREGSLAHAMAAAELKNRLGLDVTEENREIHELYGYHSGEMEEHVEAYVNYVWERYEVALKHTGDARLLVEARLDYSLFVPGGFGTGDAVIISEDCMEVIDLKYGKGVEVSADDNPQMKLYALGALEEWRGFFDIDTVRMTIFQPRLYNCSVWEASAMMLLEWATNTVAPLANVAARGLGARQSGPWCRFCKVKGSCGRLAKDSLSTVDLPVDTLTPAEIGRDLLPRVETAKIWIKAVEETALGLALSGQTVEGYKVVEGRSNRTVSDHKALGARLEEAGYDHDAVWKEPELQTITYLEKLVGKKRFGTIAGDLLVKPAGKPTLVPESDRRKALDIADEFDNIKIES